MSFIFKKTLTRHIKFDIIWKSQSFGLIFQLDIGDRSMAVTLKDISVKSGINTGSVSHVLNNHPKAMKLKAETREKIRRTARELGYFRNEIARAMVTGRSNVIGFLMHDIPSEHCARLQNGVMKAAQENNYLIKVFYAKPNCNAMDFAKICIGQRLSGLIAYDLPNNHFFSQLNQQISKHGIPLAIAAGVSHLDVDNCTRIYANNIQGGALAFKHLYAQGHRSFFISAEYSSSEWADKRLNGFVAAAQEAGISIPETNICRAKGINSFKKAELKSRIKTAKATAVFCMSDFAALSIITKLQQLGINVPSDIAVVGYGNLSFCDFSSPAITSIEEHLAEIGSRALNVLLDQIKSGNKPELTGKYSETLDVELVARESTAALKKF